ncbi:hypothetical protein Rhopal_005670-T1 [Rhodotorula paludigena]|uniref:Disintegrin and metalloproteinase domain-containing protein B n=1 Tax=Rhodotorula paludigena TaxID=86838 RepID=A0AAV5GRV4_9BASI|nr:hypothetical protein Rhopal_005670-T1 [Rhodotorula paludigena]
MLAPSLASLAAAAALAVLGASPSASAASVRPPPLHPRALAHPRELSVHVVDPVQPQPRSPDRRRSLFGLPTDARHRPSTRESTRVRWDDRFLVSFLAHDDEPVTLSLRPAADLVPAQGIRSLVRSRDPDSGEWSSVDDVLRREDVRAYEGWVLNDDEDVERWIREEAAGVVRQGSARGAGWARLVVSSLQDEDSSSDDEPQLRFQGTYMKGGETYTIHSTERYLRTKDLLDPEPPLVAPARRSRRAFGGADDEVLAPRHPSMVIVRESATLTPHERIAALKKRGLPLPDVPTESQSCSHDSLPFNVDPAHPVYSAPYQHAFASAAAANTSSWLPSIPIFPFSSSEDAFTPADHSSPFSAPNLSPHRYVPRSTLERRQSGNDIGGGGSQSSNFINSIGSTAGCPKSAMVVFVGVAADCTYTQAYGSPAAAREQILTDFNQASALYQDSFNISLGIVELQVMNASCPSTQSEVDPAYPWNLPCQASSGSTSAGSSTLGIDLNSRLSVFSQWRGDKGASDGAGLWHLLTECQTGSEVGVAWLGQLCKVTASSNGGQVTSGTGVTAITRSEWQVVAHEIGHNFGAIHDCAGGCSLSSSCCPLTTSTCNANADYIMSPVSEKNVSSFSPCSIGNICSTLSNSLNTTCLANPGAAGNPAIISLQACGNGILEDGEECDPGSDTDDPCCDAQTCRFAPGAVCDPRNSLCCTSQCQIAGAGTVCRASQDQRCDREETCDGSSRDCPDDEYESDGTGCGSGLSCASGVCTSRDEQCRNAGSSLDLQSACPTSASFRDGTACGYGGRCRGGECQSGSALDTAGSWYRNNLQIAIPVTIVAAIVALLILAAILRCCGCCGSRGRKGVAAFKPARNQSHSARYAAAPPPMAQSNGYGGGYGGGGYGGPPGGYNAGGYGGGSQYAPPPGPPPSHPSSAYQGNFNHGPRNVLRR